MEKLIARIQDALATWLRISRDPSVLPRKQIKERLATCETCPAYDRGICTECWCVMKLKARFKESECPRGHWKGSDEF